MSPSSTIRSARNPAVQFSQSVFHPRRVCWSLRKTEQGSHVRSVSLPDASHRPACPVALAGHGRVNADQGIKRLHRRIGSKGDARPMIQLQAWIVSVGSCARPNSGRP